MARKKVYKLHEKVYARAMKKGTPYLMYGEITSIRYADTENEFFVITDKHNAEYKVTREDLYKTYDEMIDDERNYL